MTFYLDGNRQPLNVGDTVRYRHADGFGTGAVTAIVYRRIAGGPPRLSVEVTFGHGHLKSCGCIGGAHRFTGSNVLVKL